MAYTATYNLSIVHGRLTQSQAALLNDIEASEAGLELQSLVASGDYFELLATKLDQIEAQLASNSYEAQQLQRIVQQLLLAQHKYRITPK